MISTRATSFGAWAEHYDDHRPTYPDDAVDWLLPPHAARVAEVGAGAGKLTDRLVGRGLDLDVVEPDGRMLAVVADRHPALAHPEDTDPMERLDLASGSAVQRLFRWTWTSRPRSGAVSSPRSPTSRSSPMPTARLRSTRPSGW